MSVAPTPASATPLELSVVIPCLNEARTIAGCVREAMDALAASGIAGRPKLTWGGQEGAAALTDQGRAKGVRF